MKPHRIEESRSHSAHYTSNTTQQTRTNQSADEDMEVTPTSSVSQQQQTHVMRDDTPTMFQLKPQSPSQERSAPNRIGVSSQEPSTQQKKSLQDWVIPPHPQDVGRLFMVSLPHHSSPVVAKYLGHDGSDHIFEHHGQKKAIAEENIHGYRPTVGRSYPTGIKPRSEESRLDDRNLMMLSAGDLSEPMARQRKDPQLASQMATTTFEQEPNYATYASNQEQLSRLGVPILNNMNLSKPSDVQRMQNLPDDAHVHFQMPRVPQGTSGYSTQKLIRDTASIPTTLDKPELQITITTPQPSHYKTKGKHNQIYGMENGSALKGTDRQVRSKQADENLEQFGYGHRQTTKDDSTDAAKNRVTYTLEPKPKKDDDDDAMVT